MRIYISQAGAHTGETVELVGWMYNSRSSGKLRFLLVRDGTGLMQCIVSKLERKRTKFVNDV
ncbi:MAG: hypothetical protein FJY65_05435 [Calditrichaeota bacterium]|nr:hypothetical protein [Calditrichota bacterium]